MEHSRQLDKDFEHYLHKAAHLSDRIGDRLFQKHAGITVMQYLLLQALREKGQGAISQQDLVVYLSTTKGAISRQITNARQQGLLEVQVSPTSRREYELSLTEKGRQVLVQAEQLNESLGLIRPKYLSDEEMTITIKTLKTICDLLEEMETHS